MNKIIGYEIEADCSPYKNWFAFRISKDGAEAVKKEMKSYGYKKITIKEKIQNVPKIESLEEFVKNK